MKLKVRALCAALSLSLLLCTACGAKKTTASSSEAAASVGSSVSESEPTAESETAESEAASEEAVPVVEDHTAEFVEAFEQVPTLQYGEELENAERHVLVNDYNGDGVQEAYAFYAVPDSDFAVKEGTVGFDCISLYYIDSQYNTTCIAGGDSGFASFNGFVVGMTDAGSEDYSNCYLEVNGLRFVVFEACAWEGDWYTLAYGADAGGEPTGTQINATDFKKAGDGSFTAVKASGKQVEYKLIGSTFEKVWANPTTAGSKRLTVDDLKAVLDANKEELYEENYSTYGNPLDDGDELDADYGTNASEPSACFLPADYDGDGKSEAYVVIGRFTSDDFGPSGEYVDIYFINSKGELSHVYGLQGRDYDRNSPLFGYIYGMDIPTGEDESNLLIDTGSTKFLVWQLSGYGSGGISFIFGVKDGEPFQSQISGTCGFFDKNEEGSYVGYEDTDTNFTEVKYRYDEAVHDFVKIEE